MKGVDLTTLLQKWYYQYDSTRPSCCKNAFTGSRAGKPLGFIPNMNRRSLAGGWGGDGTCVRDNDAVYCWGMRKKQSSQHQPQATETRPRTPTFLMELPLLVDAGQARCIRGYLEAGRALYNAVLSERLSLLRRRRDLPAWQQARAIPRTQPQERRAALCTVSHLWQSHEYETSTPNSRRTSLEQPSRQCETNERGTEGVGLNSRADTQARTASAQARTGASSSFLALSGHSEPALPAPQAL